MPPPTLRPARKDVAPFRVGSSLVTLPEHVRPCGRGLRLEIRVVTTYGVARGTLAPDLVVCRYLMPVAEAAADWPQIRRFAEATDRELPFRSLTYQELFAKMEATTGPEEEEYTGYLLARYFGEGSRRP
jgi:hypothetical protein